MNDDLRLQRYLASRADAIDLAPADPAGVVRRGNRRRARRRIEVLGAVAVLAVGATTLAVYDSGDADVRGELGAALADSPFDWTTAVPDQGLAYSNDVVELADGSIYALSSAPGVPSAGDATSAHLYRSGDSIEWDEASTPSSMKPSALAGAGDTLYALGTAPAGGGARDLVVSASTDGARSWSSGVTLPPEVAILETRFPEEIAISNLHLAASDTTHLVASLTVTAQIDPEDYLGVLPTNASWNITPAGIEVYELPEATGCVTDPAYADLGVRCAGDPTTTSAAAASSGGSGPGELVAEHTWAELGVDPELAAYVGGRPYVFTSDDGETFERVLLPGDPSGWGGALIATPDGYRYFLGEIRGDVPRTLVFGSADGRTWEQRAALEGYAPGTAGVLGGSAAIALLSNERSQPVVQVEAADGTWHTLDVTAAVDAPADTELWIGNVAFGPLGLAADVGIVDPHDPAAGSHVVVHSTDGSTLSAVEIDPEVGSSIAGITVSADAITVRITAPDDLDPATPPTQTLLVGTPK